MIQNNSKYFNRIIQRLNITWLLHTQENSENLHFIENLRETQGILIFFKLREPQGSFDFPKISGKF